MKDRLKLDPFAVEGRVTAQLFDAKTGKQVDEKSGRNFISRAVTEKLLRIAQRYAFAHQHPTQWDMAEWVAFRHDDDSPGFFHWMILTDSALAETPATEHVVPGAIIGYANRQTHTDGDLRRGIINRSESRHTPAQTKWVMDWATDRGNGTIQSVCWGRNHWGSVPLQLGLGQGLGTIRLDWRSGFTESICNFYEGDYWINSPGTVLIRRLAATTGAQVWSRSLPAPSIAHVGNAVAVRGDHIFYTSSTARLIRHTISTNVNTDLGALLTTTGWERLALMGDIIYITTGDRAHAAGTALVLQRYNAATAAWMTNLSIPSLPANVRSDNIFPIEGRLRIGAGTELGQSFYHDIDVVAATITPLGFPSAAGQYLFGHGNRLKVWRPTQATHYVSTTMLAANGLLFDIDDMRGNFLLSRIRLASPIIKTSANTLKVIYDFNYA